MPWICQTTIKWMMATTWTTTTISRFDISP
jgi:hypothetical protein